MNNYDTYSVSKDDDDNKCPSLMELLIFQINKKLFDKYAFLNIVAYERGKKTFTTVLQTERFLSVKTQMNILEMFSAFIETNKDFFIEEVFDKHESGLEFFLELKIINIDSVIIFDESVNIVS